MLLFPQDNARISGMVSIAQSLKVKAEEAEVVKTDLDQTQAAFMAFREAK